MKSAGKNQRRSKLTIGVLYGGRSGEHDVSLCSAASVVAALDKTKYDVVAIGIDRDGRWYVQDRPEIIADKDFGRILSLKKKGAWLVNHFEDRNRLHLYDMDSRGKKVVVDLVFPVLHGTYGEDGTMQGLLELARVPYVGVDVAGSAIGMDKDVAKRLLAQEGVPVVPWITVSRSDWLARPQKILRGALKRLEMPVFVKPLRTGSSVGIKKVKVKKDLAPAVDYAFGFDTRIMIEKGIDCREIECAVLGNEDPRASVLGEILPTHEYYSYEAKYLDPEGAKMNIPAKIPARLAAAIRKCAVLGFRALNCNSMARVDFFLDKKTGAFYLNEINTLPGFTGISMYPKLWEATGLSYSALLDRLVELALARHREKSAVITG
ncbi:MAG TPA: D-alanine--D-alanine ligase family protein [Smithellaceae bacterium]|nr:D-alanine--D-alanine ligase family protein [Smithellaceae bacterium]HRV45633.1 D-alanine--D-alanine ligase family protein [Smithellaceae bacterium]